MPVNGNHRSAIFRMLNLPVVSTHVTPRTGAKCELTRHLWHAAALQRRGLLEVVAASRRRLTIKADPLIGWVWPADREGPAQIVARLEQLETMIGQTASPGRALLGSRWRLESANLQALLKQG